MPIYEYVCHQCGNGFEWLVRSGEEPQCPSCGGGDLEKQWSVPAAAHTAKNSQLPACRELGPPGGCGAGDCSSGGCPFQ